jgi:subtilisin family serine protease
MRLHRHAVFGIVAVAILIAGDAALAQRVFSRSPNIGVSRGGDGGYRGGGHFYGGRIGGYFGPAIIGIGPGPVQTFESGDVIDDTSGPPRRPRKARRNSNAPAANEHRMVPNEVIIELANSVSQQQIEALQRRYRLTRVESHTFQLSGTTLYRWRIPDRRSVASVVRTLEANRIAAQPNYLFSLQDDPQATTEGDPAQYELAKLHLPQAHALAKGNNVLVAVIDSGIDTAHPELNGTVTESYDALPSPAAPHKHGTAIAGLIAAHGKLMGAAPAAHILAIRAFDGAGASAEGTTFNILKGLDWAAEHGARVINMSFAGPNDPAIHRSLIAAHKKNIVLVAAAGNAGPKSPPLYPAADPEVIAVSATDANDKLLSQSNRGHHIAVAAPGAQVLVAIPDGGYEVSSGTSYSAAEVSGIVALMLQRDPKLTPNKVRDILLTTAKDLGPKGRDVMFGAGLADAYDALMAEPTPVATAVPERIESSSTGSR